MRIALGLAALIGVAAAGCRDTPPPVPRAHVDAHPPPAGHVVAIERTHVHGDGCGHYWYDGQWYLHEGHVHGPGCGHYYHNGVWVLAGECVIEQGHIHDAHCGHYYHQGHWFYMHGHIHGPGCGHHWNGSMWVVKW